jgi:hypothetical protein
MICLTTLSYAAAASTLDAVSTHEHTAAVGMSDTLGRDPAFASAVPASELA